MSIPNDLKIGETFEDGGITYVVMEIVEGGYISSSDPQHMPKPKGRRKEQGDAGND